MGTQKQARLRTASVSGAIVVIGVILGVGILLLGRAGNDGEDVAVAAAPAHVEAIAGSEIARVTLTERAAERIDLQLTTVTERLIQGQQRLVLPYAALLYDAGGATWTYTSPEPLVFERVGVTVAFIDGGDVILSAGPAAGTNVVIVGAQQLFGAELGVGH